MNPRMRPAIVTLLLVAALAGCTTGSYAVSATPDREPLVVFLVRHAEKDDSSEDPELSVAGRERAATLADVLRSAGIEHVHSSDFIRTRETAAPTAARFDLRPELYDPRDLPSLAEKLRASGGRHLVVGHSNTTPRLVELLGGAPGSAIDESGEFDRLYVVTLGADGAPSSVMLRYGDPFDPRRSESDSTAPTCAGEERDTWLSEWRARFFGHDRLARWAIERLGNPAGCKAVVTDTFDGAKFGRLEVPFADGSRLTLETWPPLSRRVTLRLARGFDDESEGRDLLAEYAAGLGFEIDWSVPAERDGDRETTYRSEDPGSNAGATLVHERDRLVEIRLSYAL